MGVEVVESKAAHVSGENTGEENSLLKENGKISEIMGLNEPIKFGSHGMDEPVKAEINKGAEVNFPKDAVDEWPAPKQIHSFYFVRYRLHEDQKLKAKLDQAETELQRKNQARFQLIEKIKKQKADRAQKISLLKALNEENKQYRTMIDEKKKEREPLQQALGQLHGGRDRGSGICSSEEELNRCIESLEYRIKHESITLNEEKQIIREIRQLEGTREKVIANAAMRAKIQESMGEKEALEDQMKLIRVDMDGVRKDQQMVLAKRKQLEEEKEVIEKEIKSLEEELAAVIQKKDKFLESIQEMRKQREEVNSAFYQNRSLLNKARGLAEKKDVEALKELAEAEVDNFISQWSGSKAFREDYERRILSSLDNRLLSRDGRMKNPDEKSVVVAEVVAPPVTEVVIPKTNVKQPKEDSSSSKPDVTVSQKVQKEKSNKQQKEAVNKTKETSINPVDAEEGEDFFVPEKKQKDAPPEVNEVDELKLKEMKREEEIAKAKQAMERKKKLLEKAAAKAAIKAQKEAEKKLKEREKRAKKKAGTAVAAQEPEEETEAAAAAEVVEPEKVEETVETSEPPKNKDRKENAIRRRTRARGSDLRQKVLLKRKKASDYWMWGAAAAAAAAAAVGVLLLVVFGYNYFL